MYPTSCLMCSETFSIWLVEIKKFPNPVWTPGIFYQLHSVDSFAFRTFFAHVLISTQLKTREELKESAGLSVQHSFPWSACFTSPLPWGPPWILNSFPCSGRGSGSAWTPSPCAAAWKHSPVTNESRCWSYPICFPPYLVLSEVWRPRVGGRIMVSPKVSIF